MVVQTSLSSSSLQVVQSTSNIKALFLFATRFGGTISINNHGRGSKSPTACWTAYGESARQAAIALQPHSMVNIWPSGRCQRELCKRRLKKLKEAGRNVAEGIGRVLRYRTGAMGERWFGSECAHCSSPVSYQNACSLHPSFTLSRLESLSFLQVCSSVF